MSHFKDKKTLAETFIKKLGPKELILLEGPLASGKSEWVRLCLKLAFGIEKIPSPSFSLHLSYLAGDVPIDHIDLYRIQNDEELESMGFFDLFFKKKGWIFIEWADRLKPQFLPIDWPRVRLKFQCENEKRSLFIERIS